MVENTLATIVITAQSFNPSIFTETWLDKNDIIVADSIEGIRIFSSELAQFQTKEVQVLVTPPKMQISFSIHGVKEKPAIPLKVITRTIELLPHTPYQALGLNFDYFITAPNEQDFNVYDKALFGSGDNQLLKEFSAPDAKFGRYFSKDYDDFRLKLDIKPVKFGPDNKDMLQFSFNYHCEVFKTDLSGRAKKLINLINTWDSLRDYSSRLVELGTKL